VGGGEWGGGGEEGGWEGGGGDWSVVGEERVGVEAIGKGV